MFACFILSIAASLIGLVRIAIVKKEAGIEVSLGIILMICFFTGGVYFSSKIITNEYYKQHEINELLRLEPPKQPKTDPPKEEPPKDELPKIKQLPAADTNPKVTPMPANDTTPANRDQIKPEPPKEEPKKLKDFGTDKYL